MLNRQKFGALGATVVLALSAFELEHPPFPRRSSIGPVQPSPQADLDTESVYYSVPAPQGQTQSAAAASLMSISGKATS
jgi:hypothetical protein